MKKELTQKITPEMLGYVTGGANGLDGMFDGQADDPNKHLRDLLTTDGDIKGKTDLSIKHIRAIIKIKHLAYAIGDIDEKTGVVTPDETLLSVIDDFMKLRISKDRKSRSEFIEGIKGSNSMNRQEGMFNKIGSWFKGD